MASLITQSSINAFTRQDYNEQVERTQEPLTRRDPILLKHRYSHVDFYAVRAQKKAA